jgi:hypothetical protein
MRTCAQQTRLIHGLQPFCRHMLASHVDTPRQQRTEQQQTNQNAHGIMQRSFYVSLHVLAMKSKRSTVLQLVGGIGQLQGELANSKASWPTP